MSRIGWGTLGVDALSGAPQKRAPTEKLSGPLRATTPGSSTKRSTPQPGESYSRGGTPCGEGTKGARPSTVPASSSRAGSQKDLRPPLARLLDRQLQSVSTFVSSTQSELGDTLPGKGGMATSQWSEEMPSVIMFPTNRPCSRADAVVLNRWITHSLGRYADKLSGSRSEDGNLSQVVDELIPILSIGLHEVVRQVTQHCLERGVVLEKIWRTYVELFERALSETRGLLRFHKSRSMRVHEEHARLDHELRSVTQRHPEQIEKLSKTLLNKFVQRQDELEEQLRILKHENTVLKQHLDEHNNSVTAWFPLFRIYKTSIYHATLMSTVPAVPTTTTPESRIAADFKRIITALPVEGRRRVGLYVSTLLGLRSTEEAQMEEDETEESLTEHRDHNAWTIDRLQHRIQELREKRLKRNGPAAGGLAIPE